MTTQTKLAELDARALAVDLSLSALATQSRVSHATMARWRKAPDKVPLRSVSKMERRLAELEAAR